MTFLESTRSAPVTAKSSLRALDLRALEAMRNVDVRRPGNWKLFIACTQRAGLTPQSIAEALPCAASTVSRWHAGKSVPPQFARSPMKNLLIRLVEERLNVSQDKKRRS